MDDAELTFPYDRHTRFKDMEGTGSVVANAKNLRSRYLTRMQQFLEGIKVACFERDISYQLANTNEGYDHFLAAYMEKRARMKRARNLFF
jgi:cytidylate kinase